MGWLMLTLLTSQAFTEFFRNLLAHETATILITVLDGSIESILNLSALDNTDLLLVIGPKPPSEW